jgi:hypothetical protein
MKTFPLVFVSLAARAVNCTDSSGKSPRQIACFLPESDLESSA